MSIESATQAIADAVSTHLDVIYEPDQDMRSGGWFFDVDVEGVAYTVLVTEAPR